MSRPSLPLLAETGFDLLVASLALRVRSFAALCKSLSATSKTPCPVKEAALVARALKAWDRRLPWRTLCFEQGLAAMRYLGRRGYAATLHYGARGAGEELEAHVWVTSGDVPVVGCEIAADFRELRRFPEG